jgi:amino acid adenylation domain-containing protein
VRLSPELAEGLREVCRGEGVTLFMALLAGFQALLGRLSGQEDVAVGTPIAGRNHLEIEGLIGFFVNTLVLRGDLSGSPGLRRLLERCRETTLSAYLHQEVPFERLVEELSPQRSLAYSPLFQVMLALQNVPAPPPSLGAARPLPLGGESAGSATAKFDLTLAFEERGSELVGALEYSADLFDGATVARLGEQLERLLSAAVKYPETPLAELPLLSAAEREQMLVEWNDTGSPAGGDLCLHELFAARAAERPEAVALVDGEREICYGELATEAYRLAAHLQSLGVGPERVVGVFLERTPEMVSTLLAVLSAGGAYLPLDPSHPRARLERVLADSGASVVVTQESLVERLPWSGPTVVLERERGAIASCPAQLPWSGVRRENLAYVLFTSGSTGIPKGVAVTHGSAVELMLWSGRVFSAAELSGVLAATSLSFDLSVFELFAPLSWGGTAILAANALALPELPARDRVRLINTVPSAMAELVRLGRLPPEVRTVNLAGEPLARALADRIWATGTVEALWNLYGPSEDTTYSTYARVERRSSLPPRIGRPLTATRAYVVDRQGQPVPVGVGGELWLGGAGLARGYLDRPDLTAERFVPDPFSGEPGGRLYRAGDLARWLPDGDLDYLGRIDHQVKVRGFRIELGEIEAVLTSCPGVREAVVLAREDQPGDPRLVAYVVGSVEAGELREHLRGRLPEYMVPSAFVTLEAFPLTPNGKVDRKALPAPGVGREQRGEPTAPRTELERRLCEIWCEILGVERVGITDSFFDLGGHSLLATRVVSRVRSSLGRELPLRALFEHPTIEELCARLPELNRGWVLPAIEVLASREKLPLSYAQQRLWFIDRLEGGSSEYNIATAVRVRGELDRGAFSRALKTIVDRHESLRTVLREIDGEVYQVVREEVEFDCTERDLSGLPEAEREEEVRRLVLEDARTPFDLSRDLLLRVSLLRLLPQEHVVLFNMHHIASDGWSLGVLTRELRALYGAYRRGEASPLEPLRVQYGDYAHWQREWLQGETLEDQLGYWRRQLTGLPSIHGVPLDRPRPALQGFVGGRYAQRLGGDLRERLAARCRERGVTPFMFLQAAFAVLLSRYSHETDIVMGSPIAGRVHADLEPLIGFFVNTLVLRSVWSGNPRFVDLLESSRQMILDSYAHQHVPFEMLVEELKPERSLSRSPLFQILLVLQNAERVEGGLGDSRIEPLGVEGGGVSKFELELNVEELEAGLALRWLYKAELFNRGTIERMASNFGVLLEGLLERPQERVEWVPLVTEEERRRLLVEWNGREKAYPREHFLHELFEERAQRSPDELAVVFEEGGLTYGELNRRSNRLAHYLIGQDVGPATLVGLCLDRSLELLVGILGILKAGGGYVALDPESPEARLGYMLADSSAEVVLTQSHLSGLGCFAGRRVVALDDAGVGATLAGYGDGNPGRRGLRGSDVAYVIYTSGSTGQPKGVMVEHRSVAHLAFGLRESLAALGLETGYRWAWNVPVGFDASVKGLTQLGLGVELHVVPQAVRQSPGALLAYVQSRSIDVLDCTPSVLDLLLAEAEREGVGLPHLLIGGEAISAPLWSRLCAHTRLHGRVSLNLYGPTECTVDSTVTVIEEGLDPHIGGPLPNVAVYVLTPELGLTPQGGIGELHVGGKGVTRGYLSRPALTAERFIPDPFSSAPGARLYRTGDLARWRSDGNLEFLGRIDHQVKVRGFRIELGEIEAVLTSCPGVREAVVLAREDQPGDPRLVAYVVGSVESAELREHLRGRLPEYMVPSAFVLLEALPLTPNGKIDRKVLPAPSWEVSEDPDQTPRTPVEEMVAAVWCEVLGVEQVGLEESFFDLGGHSLLATRVLSRLCRAFGAEIALRELFEAPTVAGLARRVETVLRGGVGRVAPPIAPVWREARLPLSFAQQRLWFLDQLEPGGSTYNIPSGLRLSGELRVEVLAAALGEVTRRHEVLRTVFATVEGEPVQVILPAAGFRS